jgi:hypothetical protein
MALTDEALKMASDSKVPAYHNWLRLFMDVSAAIANVQAGGAGLYRRGEMAVAIMLNV